MYGVFPHPSFTDIVMPCSRVASHNVHMLLNLLSLVFLRVIAHPVCAHLEASDVNVSMYRELPCLCYKKVPPLFDLCFRNYNSIYTK